MGDTIQQLKEKVQEFRLQEEYQEMLEVCYYLLQAARELGDRQLQMRTYADYALGFYKTGDVKEAFLYIEKHAALFKDYGTMEDHLYSCHIYHLLYEYTEDYPKAKDVLETSIELASQLGKWSVVSENYSDLSYILCKLGEYDTALEVGKKAASSAAMLEPYYSFLVMKAILATTEAYLGQKNFDAAENLLQTVSRDTELNEFPKEKIRCYRLNSTLQQLRGHSQAAIDSLVIANRSAKESNDVKQQMDIQDELISLYDHLGEYKSGFEIQGQQIELLKGIHQQDNKDAAMKLATMMKLEELERQANTDFLTGLASRRALEETAEDWLSESPYGGENIVCIVFDIDNLKQWNDNFGHPFGDQVIRHVAKTCKSLFRRSDMTGRIGGDEFVTILRNISLTDACEKAEALLKVVSEIVLEGEDSYPPITLSIGVAESKHGQISDYTTLYQQADSALYRAKKNGKNQIYCSE